MRKDDFWKSRKKDGINYAIVGSGKQQLYCKCKCNDKKHKENYLEKNPHILPSFFFLLDCVQFDNRKNKSGVESLIGCKIDLIPMEEPTATKGLEENPF